ncbi:hypothetical protein BAUCODRAFT_354412 [Baudoinia panamericana UAMH 10762]|uniref:Uncharacterized protein n=1 Tax=Baudoinia panamericana (strain UAMH 10762) TaxID=717646 RepID=M2NKD2_BAUPA|nr:uncharacterized protein BAUCODRAFT_354412 [Baudoinia panamericana UAMH 10762]EMC99899.1 hypothetical protein BAUCODRAFT_354412 [Baudoinia panamericana UAMH 10762]
MFSHDWGNSISGRDAYQYTTFWITNAQPNDTPCTPLSEQAAPVHQKRKYVAEGHATKRRLRSGARNALLTEQAVPMRSDAAGLAKPLPDPATKPVLAGQAVGAAA